MTSHGRHSRTHHRWLPAVLLAIVVAAMAATSGVVGWNIADNKATDRQAAGVPDEVGASTGADPDPSSVPTSETTLTTSGATPPVMTELEQCRSWWTRQVTVGLAADASLDQWRLHIDAMNQLVAGEITVAQATDYWNGTRVGAHRLADTFRSLDLDLQGSTERCPAAGDAGEAASGSYDPLHACASAARAFENSLEAARIGMTTWEHHIHDMDLFRAGDITPEEATTMWLQSWQAGASELATYDRRAASALKSECA